MKSLYNFIIKPKNGHYNNTKKIGNTELTINADISNHRFVSREAVVLSVPAAFDTVVQKGDTVLVHFNIFRSFYDIRGERKLSSSFYKDDMYFCDPSLIYAYKRDGDWQMIGHWCFVEPLFKETKFQGLKEAEYTGLLTYGNSMLEDEGIHTGEIVGFRPNSEYEFIIDNRRVYCMKFYDILFSYGRYKEDQAGHYQRGKSRR